jgi:hypothetical protein
MELQTIIDTSIYNLPQLNQGQQNNCDGYGIAKYVMLLIYRQTGKIVNISPRWIYANCAPPGVAGLDTVTVLNFGMKVGFCTSDLVDEDTTLTEADYRNLTITPEMISCAAQYKIGSFESVSASPQAITAALLQGSAVACSIPDGNFSQEAVLPPASGIGLGLHFALIYGIAPTVNSDIIFLWDNSYGSLWGNNGDGTFLWSLFQNKICNIYSITNFIMTPPETTVYKYPKILTICKAIQNYEGWEPGSRSYRNNNPGNIDFENQPNAVLETIPKGYNENPCFAHFNTYTDGFQALYDLWVNICTVPSKDYQPTMTLDQAIFVYNGQGANSPEYAASIATALSVPVGTQLETFVQ